MVNCEGSIGTTRYRTLQARCRTSRCYYKRVRDIYLIYFFIVIKIRDKFEDHLIILKCVRTGIREGLNL